MTALKEFLNETANQIFETQMRRAAQRICARQRRFADHAA